MASPPLTGLRVVESTSIYSGPFAGMILAELGADVIKVESQSKPDLVRNQGGADPYAVSPVFYALNKGKRFVSIDAATPRGRQVYADLVAGADVFLHNIRPGKPEAMGLGYDELAARNPRLIYVGISGLGTDGPDAAQPVYDYVIQARVGMVDYQRDVETGRSTLISQVLVDKTAAQAAVQGVLASLYVRERTGRGQRVDIPMIGVGLHFQWPDAMAPWHSQVAPPIPPELLPPHMQTLPSAMLVVVQTTDGEVALSPALPPFDGLSIALDRADWVVDDRYAETLNRAINFPAFRAELNEAAGRFTTADLLERLEANGVASGPVRRRGTVHDDPQIRHLGLITEHDPGHIGAVRQPVPMWHFGETKARHVDSIGRTGEHTRDVLAEIGLDDAAIDALAAEGAVAWPT